MTTNFPSNLDNFTNPTDGDTLDSPNHAAQHADVNDAVEALQAKVGVDGSAVTTSLDYRTDQLESGNFYDTGLAINGEVTVLANVTSISGGISPAITAGVDYDMHEAFGTEVAIYCTDPTSVANWLNSLSPGDGIYLPADFSLDGNPATAEYSAHFDYGGVFGVVITNVSSNYNSNAFGSTGFFGSASTDVGTDNPSLSISGGFKIGSVSFLSDNVSISGNTISVSSDITSLVSIGDTVTQQSFSSTPQLSVYNQSTGVTNTRYLNNLVEATGLLDTLVYTTSGVFTKADYPTAKYVRVTVVGGGGGSAGLRATAAGQVSLVSGAGGGGYAIGWFDVESDLDDSADVIVGSGGVAGAAGGSGGNGGSSYFIARADWSKRIIGNGGSRSITEGVGTAPLFSYYTTSGGTADATGCFKVEAITLNGEHTYGEPSSAISLYVLSAGGGGGGFFGGKGGADTSTALAYGTGGSIIPYYDDAFSYIGFGGGAGGAAQTASRAAANGRAGSQGVVIVEVMG